MRQTLVCVAGVAISVTMFITMLSMMYGFTDKFIIETVESGGHVTVHDEPRETRSKHPRARRPHVQTPCSISKATSRASRSSTSRTRAACWPRCDASPACSAPRPPSPATPPPPSAPRPIPIELIGCDPARQTQVTTIGDNVVEGSFDRIKTTANGVVLGRGVAQTLGCRLDDSLTLTSPEGGLLFAKVVGIFDTGVTPVDYGRGYLLLSSAQTLLDRKNIINEIVIRTDDYNQADAIAHRIEGVSGYKTEGWKEANANFLKIFAVQTAITYIITAALMIVAAFGVLNILIMAVLERVNDIAILKSFGYSRGDITKIYLMQGIAIAISGAVVGLVGAKVAVESLRRLPIKLEGLVRSEGLLMSEYRSTYVLACVLVTIIVLIASVYPARRAASFDPVDVIRGAH